MIDSLANIGVSSSDSSRTYIKNEIMFCDIVALQADPFTIPTLNVYPLTCNRIYPSPPSS